MQPPDALPCTRFPCLFGTLHPHMQVTHLPNIQLYIDAQPSGPRSQSTQRVNLELDTDTLPILLEPKGWSH